MKKILYLWIPIIIIVPFAFIFLISCFIQKTAYSEIKNAILIFDFSKGMSLAEYLSIYSAILSAEVTVFLSYIIYDLGVKKEKLEIEEKINISKGILYSDAALYWNRIGEYISERYIKKNIDISGIKIEAKLFEVDEVWKEKLLLLKGEISDKDYEYLFNYFIDVKSLFLDKNLYKFLEKYTVPFWIKGLLVKEMNEIDNFEIVQSFGLYSALKRLIGEDGTERICGYGNGHRFYIEDEHGDKYLVNSVDGKKIYDFNFKSKTGFATNYIDGEIGTQGEFVDGKQISGISNNAICDEEGNYIRDWRGGKGTQVDEEIYKKNKIFHKIQADFEIIESNYVRKSDIRYIERF